MSATDRYVVDESQLFALMYDAWKEPTSPFGGSIRWDVARVYFADNDVTGDPCSVEPESWQSGGLVVGCVLVAGHSGKHAALLEWS